MRISVLAPGASRSRAGHLVDHRRVQAGEQPDSLVQRLGEVQLAAHGRGRHLAHLRSAACAGGEHINRLVLQERRVDVHDHEPHRAAVQPGSLYSHIHAELDRVTGEHRAQANGVRARNFKFNTGNGAIGQPADPVDVRPARGDAACDGGNRGGQQRPAEHGDVQPAPAALQRLARAHGDLGFHPHVGGERGDLAVDRGEVGGLVARQQHAEDEAPADHDLLDVNDRQLMPGQRGKQARGDPRPVTAGQGDQQGDLGTGHGAVNAIEWQHPAGSRVPRRTQGSSRCTSPNSCQR